jgi:hypothetical protein
MKGAILRRARRRSGNRIAILVIDMVSPISLRRDEAG